VQAIYTYENEEGTSGGTNPMGIVIHAGRISRYLEGECDGGLGGRAIGI